MADIWLIEPDFEWPVAAGGYTVELSREIADPEGFRFSEDAQKWVTDGLTLRSSEAGLRYQRPLDNNPSLFYQFAYIEPFENSVLKFANSFGLLGSCLKMPIDLSFPAGKSTIGHGEPLELWFEEIRSLKNTISLWEFLRGKELEEAEIEQLIKHFEDSDGSKISAERTTGLPVEGMHVSKLLSQDQKLNMILRNGPHYLREVIAYYIGGRVIVDIIDLPRTHRSLTGIVGARPDSLLCAIWMEFASAVSQDKKFRRCRVCTNWFEIAPGAHRSSRQFCSTACRSRAYRDRKEEARQLHAKGLSIREIAEQLGTDARTTKRWVDTT